MKLVGPMTSAIDVPTNPGERFYGIRFHLGMAGAFFDLDLTALRGSSYDLLLCGYAMAGRLTSNWIRRWGFCKVVAAIPRFPDITTADNVLRCEGLEKVVN
jgi:hypothetical protein